MIEITIVFLSFKFIFRSQTNLKTKKGRDVILGKCRKKKHLPCSCVDLMFANKLTH